MGAEDCAGRSQVLLVKAVEDFRHIAADVASHTGDVMVRGATQDVYPQPYCYLTTLLIQMHAAGWDDMDLDTLAVISGASAMFGYEPESFMPKYAFHYRDPNGLVAHATGYATETVHKKDIQEAWEFLKTGLDSGRPVSGWEGEMLLFAGYRDADAEADREVFAMKDGNGFFAEWWKWDQFKEWFGDGQEFRRHSERIEPDPERAVALRVMSDLVTLSARVPDHIQRASPNAAFGLKGIDAWAASCGDMDKHEDWGMCHPENPQWTVRNSSAVYLRRLGEATVLSADAAAHVTRASDEYRAAYRSWQKTYSLVGYAAPEGAGKIRQNRLAAAKSVREAAEHERAAIEALRQALAVEGVDLP